MEIGQNGDLGLIVMLTAAKERKLEEETAPIHFQLLQENLAKEIISRLESVIKNLAQVI